ncbi:hypothetical protein [Xenorhabdus bovienii]|uniref:hypothetical protein n=1 Tax=Xenorhabdus bovienii TaxID=40576 RepID=UPI0023B2F0E6|nr:hypothetical protein [Xenorhabdus bovienii]MDE9526370.1 hypothetical protein [Xenorhabdus bovienii]MDE9569798.1 hypothetical protein [Xenorhabdus bovienii]
MDFNFDKNKKLKFVKATLCFFSLSCVYVNSAHSFEYNRDINAIKEHISNDSTGNYMSKSPDRFGVKADKLIPLNLGIALPSDFTFNNGIWEIVSSESIFHIKNNNAEKFNIKGVGLTDFINEKEKVWINGKSIFILRKESDFANHKLEPILIEGKIQLFEIINCGNGKCLLLSNNNIPSVYSIPELKKIKSYDTLEGYEAQHLSAHGNTSFIIAMKDNNWSLYKDDGMKLHHVAHLNGYANGLYAASKESAIVGNRNELILFTEKNGKKTLINGFTHVMRIKKIMSDICVLDSDDPFLICFDEKELLDKDIKSPKFKVIAGNLFSYSSIVGVAKNDKSDDIFVTTRPGRIWKKNISTGKQEIVAGNGGNSWIDVNVPAIYSPIYYQTGIAFDGKYIYVAEQHGIYRVDTHDDIETRKFELYAGSPQTYGDISDSDRLSARFLSIRDLAITSDGGILVSDTGNNKIKKISTDGRTTTIAGGGEDFNMNKIGIKATDFSLKEPLSAAADAEGNLYVADSLDNVVIRVNTSGVVDKIMGSVMRIDYQGHGYGDALFNTPSGVHVDNGKIFVTDSSSVKWAEVDSADQKSCWLPIEGAWYYPMNPIIKNGGLYINNTGSNDVKLSAWSTSKSLCK